MKKVLIVVALVAAGYGAWRAAGRPKPTKPTQPTVPTKATLPTLETLPDKG
jgi:hypothetical protein